jgi:hypothetical protein
MVDGGPAGILSSISSVLAYKACASGRGTDEHAGRHLMLAWLAHVTDACQEIAADGEG